VADVSRAGRGPGPGRGAPERRPPAPPREVLRRRAVRSGVRPAVLPALSLVGRGLRSRPDRRRRERRGRALRPVGPRAPAVPDGLRHELRALDAGRRHRAPRVPPVAALTPAPAAPPIAGPSVPSWAAVPGGAGRRLPPAGRRGTPSGTFRKAKACGRTRTGDDPGRWEASRRQDPRRRPAISEARQRAPASPTGEPARCC